MIGRVLWLGVFRCLLFAIPMHMRVGRTAARCFLWKAVCDTAGTMSVYSPDGMRYA